MNYDVKIDKFGTKRYYINNVLHREDGPAVEYASGDTFWYKYGNIHREDGPAHEYAGYKEWYLNHKCYGYDNDFTDESWKFFVKTILFS